MRIKRWNEKTSTSVTNEVAFILSRRHLDYIEEPLRTSLTSLIETRDILGLVSFTFDPASCSFGQSVYHGRQLLAYFQKRSDIDLGIDTREIAWQKFVAAELKCKESNEVFRCMHRGAFSFTPRVNSVLFRAQRKIADILGPVPSLDSLKFRFGPGATTQVKKKDSSVRRKLDQVFACSGELSGTVGKVLEEMPAWVPFGESETATVPVQIHTGKISFVPKNASTDRTIGVEPMLNTVVQLGIGDYIADRLKAFGVDLSDQTFNQGLAREGSITGALATLDLSSASDCISIQLVGDLLPIDWFLFLSQFRTGMVEGPDGICTLEKFSSMGNGFTFPLESLIFYALAYGACGEDRAAVASVYGDDIIISRDYSLLLVDTLTACGFEVNMSKSFFSGPFRESCGKDYFLGSDVRPLFLKDALIGQDLFRMHNFFVQRGLTEFADVCLEYIDESLRIWGPPGFGDGHLIGDYEPKPLNREHQWSGSTFETYTYRSRKGLYSLQADYVFPAYSIYIAPEEFNLDGCAVRGVKSLYRRFRVKLSGDFRPPSHGSRKLQGGDRHDPLHHGVMFGDSLPGVDGCRRVKIYNLACTE